MRTQTIAVAVALTGVVMAGGVLVWHGGATGGRSRTDDVLRVLEGTASKADEPGALSRAAAPGAGAGDAARAERAYRDEIDPSARLAKGSDFVKRHAQSNRESAEAVFRDMVTTDLVEAAEIAVTADGHEEVHIQPHDYAAVIGAFLRLAEDAPGNVADAFEGMDELIAFDLLNNWIASAHLMSAGAFEDFVRSLGDDYRSYAAWGAAEYWAGSEAMGPEFAVERLAPLEDLLGLEAPELVARAARQHERWMPR